ncbi:hypothetical protein ACFQV2_23605 [Actinokineospora soli]|uniref:Uncharacterized protein n=1 Tax=Actinokineospora soli TaxID=1048753 RepID=A0ABW2TT89_9PSEU
MTRAVLLVLLLTLTGCSDDRGDVRVGPSAPVAAPLPPDAGLRPVPLPGGDGFAYLRPEPAAQALCHALDPVACTVRTSLLEIRIGADESSPVVRGEPHRRVAGFPVWIDLSTTPTAAVGFLDPDFDNRPVHQTDARAVIEITVAHGTTRQRGRARNGSSAGCSTPSFPSWRFRGRTPRRAPTTTSP